MLRYEHQVTMTILIEVEMNILCKPPMSTHPAKYNTCKRSTIHQIKQRGHVSAHSGYDDSTHCLFRGLELREILFITHRTSDIYLQPRIAPLL